MYVSEYIYIYIYKTKEENTYVHKHVQNVNKSGKSR